MQYPQVYHFASIYFESILFIEEIAVSALRGCRIYGTREQGYHQAAYSCSSLFEYQFGKVLEIDLCCFR